MTKSRKLAYLALLITAIIWGIAPPVIKYTLNFLSPISFLFYRFLIACLLISFPLFRKFQRIKPSRKDLLFYLFLGFLCAPVNLILLFLGIQRTTASDASLISIISPILVILGGSLFLNENITKIEKVGILITLLGTLLTVLQPIFDTSSGFGKNILGNFFILLGTLVWVVFTLLTKKRNHQNRFDPLLLTGLSFFVGLITISPLFAYERLVLIDYFKSVFLATPSIFAFDLRALPGLFFISVFSSLIAYLAYIYGLNKIEASEATIFTYLQPLFAVPISVIFLGETLSLPFLIGAIFIVLGVFICEYRWPNQQ